MVRRRFVPAGDDDRNDAAASHSDARQAAGGPEEVHPMPASGAGYGDDVDAAAVGHAAELAAAAAGDADGIPASISRCSGGRGWSCGVTVPGFPACMRTAR